MARPLGENRRHLTVNSTETYQAACLAGLGIIQVPRTGVREALRAGELIEILPQYRADRCRYRYLSAPAQPLPPGTSVYGVAGERDERVRRLGDAALYGGGGRFAG
jgi:DNA-binding transcriptional LysR family regulator